MPKLADITSTEDHPNRAEIFGVLAQMVHICDEQLPMLAGAWTNSELSAQARSRALSPDSPMILEVLTTFESMTFLFAEDLSGARDYVVIDPAVASLAMKAVRDAVAAAYARPVLSVSQHTALIAPWRTVFPRDTLVAPDYGPAQAQVAAILQLLPLLGSRCHDPRGQQLWDDILATGLRVHPARHSAALEHAWNAAVQTRRRRLWRLARRTGFQAYHRRCDHCAARPVDGADVEVLSLCLGAVYGLLVRDAIEDSVFATLSVPLAALIPQPPPAGRQL